MAVDTATTLIASLVGVAFVLGTIAVVICCLCCWKKKRTWEQGRNNALPQTNNNVQPGQAYTVPPPSTGGAVMINPTPGQGPAVVVPSIMPPMGPQTMGPPGPMPVQYPGAPRGPHPGQPVGPHGGPRRPHPQQAMRHPQPTAPPMQPGRTQQNGQTSKTLPQTNKKLQHLTKRRSVTDNQYLGLNIPAPQDSQALVKRNISVDPKLDEMAMMIGRAILKNLEAISIDADRITRKDVLGSGQYGVVYRGELSNVDMSRTSHVALKTIAGDASDNQNLQEFIEEMLRMKTFNHKHVMPMLGMTYIDKKPYMVLPFMDKGDLRTYIADSQNTFLVGDLLRFINQVAKGMHYLSQQNIIHGDLAARNCMVDQNCDVKVADFGLSRHLHQSDYYSLQSSGQARPLRWLAPECLDSQRKYTVKSDVWAYGIFVWEVMTRGLRPYPDFKSNDEVIIEIQKGYRMPCPEYTATEIYDIMTHCWSKDPANRPSFEHLEGETSLLMEQNSGEYEQPVRTSK